MELLKRENIENEKAKGYIQVLEQKSHRLKHLTEDLVEASKISSGNIKLECMQLQMQEMIYQAAQRSRGEYIGMMGTVAGLKAQTGDTFSSVREAVAFTELLQKQFKIAGTDATGIASNV